MTTIEISEKEYWQSKPFFSCEFMAALDCPYENTSQYTSIGHFVQASKAKMFDDSLAFSEIMRAKTREEQEKHGRSVRNFDEKMWKEWKSRILQSAFNCQQSTKYGHERQWYRQFIDPPRPRPALRLSPPSVSMFHS